MRIEKKNKVFFFGVWGSIPETCENCKGSNGDLLKKKTNLTVIKDKLLHIYIYIERERERERESLKKNRGVSPRNSNLEWGYCNCDITLESVQSLFTLVVRVNFSLKGCLWNLK